MSSPLRPIENADQRGIMFWLPPGGVDNGVWANAWTELADLQPADVGPVLGQLADADIGGYVATPGGCARHPGHLVIHRLWVDSLQYHKAEDMLMAYVHTRTRARDRSGQSGLQS